MSFLSLAIVALLAGGCRDAPEVNDSPRPVRVVVVGDEAAFSGRRFPGRASALRHADLSFRVGGTLMSMPSRIGENVEEGQVIARLDPRDFEVRVRAGEAAVARAESELTRASEEFTRANTAFERGVVTEIELIRIREARNVAAATLEAIQADLQSARDDLTDSSLRAPFDAEVAARFVENFEDVQPRQRVLRVIDDLSINFIVSIPESLIGMMPYVEEIRCEFDAFPGREIVATIDEVGREADPVTRTFPVTLVMEQPEGARILAGMTGRAWVSRIRSVEGAINEFVLPTSALTEDAAGARFVWVIDPGSNIVSRRAVTIGRVSSEGIAVNGLQKGDIVATAGASFLREGQRVRPTDDVGALGGASSGSGGDAQ
jgi:RND family efflux transporter MFP subunit